MRHITVILGIDTATVSPEPSPEVYTELVKREATEKLAEVLPDVKFDFEFSMDDNAETQIRFGNVKLSEREKDLVSDTIQTAESNAISDPAAYGG